MQNNSDSSLTIIVPVHNMAGRLQNLAESITSAKNTNTQIILIDDNSSDGTFLELQNLTRISRNIDIQLLRVSFHSPGLARNAGLELVDTKYFSFADSDDKFYAQNIWKALNNIPSETEILIGSYKESEHGKNGSRLVHPRSPLWIDFALNPGLWRMVFKTSSVKGTRFKNFRMAEDQLWMAEVGLLNKNIACSSEVFYEYFSNNPGSLTSNTDAIGDLSKVLIEYCKLFDESKYSNTRLLYSTFARIWMSTVLRSNSLKRFYSLILMFLKQAFKSPKLIGYSIMVLIMMMKRGLERVE